MREIRFEQTWVIEITKRPAGPAPEWVRDAWVGLLLPAIPMHYQDLCREHHLGLVSLVPGQPVTTPEVDQTTRRAVPGRNGFVVLGEVALGILAERNPAAADWFAQYPLMSGTLIFGPDEGEVVEVVEKTVVLQLQEPEQDKDLLRGWYSLS